MNQVIIAIEYGGELPWRDFVPFQGKLKYLTKDDYERMKALILRDGYAAAMHVWRHGGKLFTIDGHQRCLVLEKMSQEGIQVPDLLPTMLIHAKDVAQAKRILMGHVSQFGRIDGEGLYQFQIDADIQPPEMDEFYRLPDIDLDLHNAEYFQDGNPVMDQLGNKITQGEDGQVNENMDLKRPDIKYKNLNLFFGDSLERLSDIEENSIDALITDPPAGIAFMNANWDDDKGGRDEWIKWLSGIMEQCHKAMKPGAHGLIWALPRTSHWTGSALENAGFEIRDVVTHLFGSGFPKSLNISKAIDKEAGVDREITGNAPGARNGNGQNNDYGTYGSSDSGRYDLKSTPATPAAKQWDGFGTALKPASEHWILIRKPLSEKTVAKNVLRWGVGGINIDKSRIHANNNAWEKEQTLCDSCAVGAAKSPKRTTQGILENTAAENADTRGSVKTHGRTVGGTNSAGTGCSEETSKENINTSLNTSMCGRRKKGLNPKGMSSTTSTQLKQTIGSKTCSACGSEIMLGTTKQGVQGRFPANLILDDVAGELLDRQSGELSLKGSVSNYGPGKSIFGIGQASTIFKDKGGASRFFYCAKPSVSERNAGLEGETETVNDGRETEIDNPFQRGETERLNIHPTVKPIKLMEYLIRLITPPEGVVLDPFMGSGTTGIAAINEKMKFYGIEREVKYFDIAKARLEEADKKIIVRKKSEPDPQTPESSPG